MSNFWSIVVGLLLLGVNAVFVAGEFCLTSTRRSQLEPLAEAGNRRAKTAIWAIEHLSLLLAVSQLGITLASTALGAIAEPAVASLLEKPLSMVGVPHAMLHPIALFVALAIVVFLHIFLGEMIPKNLTVSASLPVCLLLAPILVRLARSLSWLVNGLNVFANLFVRLFGVEPQDEVAATYTVEEVATIVEESEKAGILSDDLGLLSGSLNFSKATVESIMVPLPKILALPWPCSAQMVEMAVAETGFSRFLIWEPADTDDLLNNPGDVVALTASFPAEQPGAENEYTDAGLLPTDRPCRIKGYLHIKDVLCEAEGSARQEAIEEWRVRPLPDTQVEQEIEEALRVMQQSGVHMAQVKENHLIKGVIFLEDILEELVGEVRDSMQRNLR